MKKLYCAVFCILLGLSLTGCKKSSDVTAVTTGLSFTAEISAQDKNLICDGAIDENGDIIFTVTSPEKIKGLCYSFSGDSAQISFNGLTYPLDTLPYENSFTALKEIFSIVRKDEKNITSSNNSFFYSGECSFGEFRLFLGESGLPISASFSESGIEILFKNATIM